MPTLHLPPSFRAEQTWLIRHLLGDRLGLDLQPEFGPEPAVVIRDDAGHSLTIAADLFTRPEADWLTPASLPREPLAWWEVPDIGAGLAGRRLPVLYGRPDFHREGDAVTIGADLFGTAFFLLSRMEEVVNPVRDLHGRFPASASLASRAGFLHRPVVDEWVEVLWACLRLLWPRLERPAPAFRVLLSHDVDFPQRYAAPLRRFAADLVKGGSPRRAFAGLAGWAAVAAGRMPDPWDTFDTLMDISEAAGLTSAFYFITDWSVPAFDRSYRFDSPKIRALLRRIARRGHEIGLHASYGTIDIPDQTAREFAILRRVCAEEGIEQERWGGRQHYLRWRTPDTFRNWEAAGLDYDSTLGFADAAGFRCGTAREFPVFDVVARRPLRLVERPLLVMDCTIMDDRYEGLGTGEAALARITAIKETCRRHGGDFTLLWHNNRLADPAEAVLYGRAVTG